MRLKRIILYILCVALLSSCVLVANAETNDNTTFTTSDNICYSLNEFDIYIEDFKDVDFETSQQVVDYIYNIGSSRQKTRDAKYDTLFGKSLTKDELELIISHPIYASSASECAEKAVAKTEELYPNNNGDGQLGNAFQHTYWVILMYYYTSPSFAIDFAVAHENYDGNPDLHRTMDLYNNYAAYNYCNQHISSGIYYMDANLKSFASDMMQGGLLEYIIFGYEYVSRVRYYEATGNTIEIKATGDFYAFTNTSIPHNVPDPLYEVIPALVVSRVMRKFSFSIW